MRIFSARFGPLALALAVPAMAQNKPPPPAAAVPAPVSTTALAPAWRPFQEFAFLEGSWSGTAESGTKVGGRVARFTPELSGSYLVHRGSTVLSSDDGKQETIEEVGYFAYDREKRRYVASYFFSTGIAVTFDVEIAPEGVRLASRELLNAEAGTKARMLFSRKGDAELAVSMDLAPGGKDFVPFLSSTLHKK